MTTRFLWLTLLAPMGCLSAPEIVVVDRATALEEQAAGSFEQLERRLDRAGLAPRPVPLTPEQLRALGIAPPPLIDNSGLTAADEVDGLLTRHCLGEGLDGLLVATRASCEGAADPEVSGLLIERVNRARLQLWRWMRTVRPEATAADLKAAWREAHLRGVACGAWIQQDDGRWGPKRC